MKAFRVKETIAALMGLAAPYWALLGLGIIDPAQLQLLTFTNLFHSFAPPAGLLGLLILTGGTILIGTMSGLSNAFHGEWGNSRNLAFNKFINLLGFASAMFAIIDNNNMLAYCATINLCMAIQGAKMLNRSRTIRAGLVYTLFCALYITAFIFIIYV